MRETSADTTQTISQANSPESFERFLNWLDCGTATDGESYLRMRKKLVAYFDRRNCLHPEELADETLNRAVRRLDEEGKIDTESPAKYCYLLARFVLLEYFRSTRTREVPLEAVSPAHLNGSQPTKILEEAETREKLLTCLTDCMGRLETDQRDLVLGYYYGERRTKIDNRRRLAGELGISVNALSIRAYRIREKLEGCVNTCAGST